MMTGDEREALQVHSIAYQEWAQSWATLREVVGSGDSDPRPLQASELNAMAAEFVASREVVRTAIEYANACSVDGPNVEDVVGGAFVMALVGVVREELAVSLEQDFVDLTSRHDQWLSDAAVWVPSSSDSSAPARPSAPESVRRVYGAARDLAEHRQERAHESLAEGLAEAGRQQGLDVRDETTVYADGSTQRVTEIWFGRDGSDRVDEVEDSEAAECAMTPGDRWPSTGVFSHWRDGWKGSWRVMRRNERSIELGDEVSSHRQGADAFEAAHRTRQHIDRDEVIDIVEWRTGGWLLRDTMPALSSDEVDEKNGAEVVYGARVDGEPLFNGTKLIESYPVALLLPFHIGWQILVAAPDEPEAFERPTTMKEALYDTRMAAIAGARRLAGMK